MQVHRTFAKPTTTRHRDTRATTFTQQSANLMTVNSIAPSNGCGVVTIAAETSHLGVSVDEMLQTFQQTPAVIKAEILAAG